MEISYLFINENLFNLIYNNLAINDKVNFSSINKYSYNNYKGINKLRVYEYVNKDYKLFRKALEKKQGHFKQTVLKIYLIIIMI